MSPTDQARRGAAEAGTDRLIRSSTLVALGTALSRVTGLLRVIALAVVLGGGTLADAYNLANNSPNIIYELLLGGVLSAALIPVLVQALRHHDEDGPSAVFTMAFLALAAVTVAAVALAPVIFGLYSWGLPDSAAAAQRELVVPFLHLILPEILFYGIAALAGAALNARRRFIAAAYAPAVNNLVVIVVAVLLGLRYLERRPVVRDGQPVRDAGGQVVTSIQSTLAESPGAKLALGLGTTAGIVAMAVVLLWAMRRADIVVRWRPEPRHPMVRKVARLSSWMVGYVAANQVALILFTALANRSGSGNVTAYANAFIYFQLPHGLIAVSVMTVIMPDLSDAAAAGDEERFDSRFLAGLRITMLLMIPAAVAYVILAGPIVDVLLSHGAYAGEAARLAGRTLTAFAWGLPLFSLYIYALRALYARLDTRTPFLLNCAQNALAIGLGFLWWSHGAPGLAAAFSVSYAGAAALTLWVVHRRLGGLGAEAQPTAAFVIRVVLACVPMALVLVALRALTDPRSTAASLGLLALAVPVGVGVFLVAARFLDINPVERVMAVVRRRNRTGPDDGLA